MNPNKMPNPYWKGMEDPVFLTLRGYDKHRYFRRRIWEIFDCKCAICGEYVAFEDTDIDHIVPKSLGGEDHYTNMHPTHATCNRAKGNYGNNHHYSGRHTEEEIAKRKALGETLKRLRDERGRPKKEQAAE